MAVPTVATVGVNNVTGTTANLIGSFNPNGSATTARFFVGTSLPTSSLTNVVPNPSFDHDAVGGAPTGWGNPGALTSFVVSNAWSDQGGQSLRLVTTAQSSTGQPSLFAQGPDNGPGGLAAFHGWNAARLSTGKLMGRYVGNINSLGGGTWEPYMEFWCYDNTGALISGLQGTPPLPPRTTTGVFSAVGVLQTLPANTAWFRVSISLFCTTAGTLDISIDSFALFFDVTTLPVYFDGDTPGYVWSGTPGNSSSIQSASLGDPVNLVLNPSFEHDTVGAAPAGWTNGLGAVFAVQTGWSQVGSNSLRMTSTALAVAGQQSSRVLGTGLVNGIPITGGQQYTFSGWVNRLSSGGTSLSYLQTNWLDVAGSFISASTSKGGGSRPPTAFSGNGTTGINHDFLTVTAPSNAVYVQVLLVQNGGASGGTADAYFDALMFNAGSLPGAFADGDAPGYTWLGTPGNSGTTRGASFGSVGAGTVPVTATAETFGLTPGATYYFAAVGTNASGTTTSWTDSFVASSPVTTTSDPVVELGSPIVTTPHFDFPFTLTVDPFEQAEVAANEEEPNEVEGYARVVEQGSLEEVAACVKAVFACPLGACVQLPTFGVRSLLFTQMPPSADDLLSQVQQWEPRATLSIASNVLADQSTWAVNVTVSAAGDPSN